MHKPKLFLLDGFALIFRAHFAFINNPRITSKGLNTSAVFGFTNTILEVIKNQQPTHIAVAFDTEEPTHRHLEAESYKANRDEMPEDIAIAIPYIYQLLDAMNIKTYAIPGFEADDIIGTIAKQAEVKGFEVFMMTPDKDFGQLVSENIKIYKPGRQGNAAEILGVAEICKKYEINHPSQVIDILGLMGDAVDNIPGVPGVGEKTAMQLIKQFQSIESLLENTNQLKGKLKEKVEANKELAIQSKRLATIITDMNIDWNANELKIKTPDEEKIKLLFNELEFKTLLNKFTQQEVQGDLFSEGKEIFSSNINNLSELSNIGTVTHDYILINTDEEAEAIAKLLNTHKVICFDTETTSLDTLEAKLVGISFAVKPHQAWYVAIPQDEAGLQRINIFKSVLQNPEIKKIAQNFKYDYAVLKNHGILIKGEVFDTMIAHYVLQPEGKHNMDMLAAHYLSYQTVSIEQLIGPKGKNQLSMNQVPLDKIKDYAAEDADITFQLYQKLNEEVNTSNFAKKILETIEIPLIPVLASMEESGVNIDVDVLKNMSKELEEELKILEKTITEMAGLNFNIASPKQLGEVLFEKLNIDEKAKKTKTGQYATGEDVLAKLENKHPIISKILDYREVQKLKNTYVDALPQMINTKTGRIHTSFNQTVAATGRLSSNNPNLQNIPIRTEKGREIRKAFIAGDSNSMLLSADYSQIELRIIASMSNDENMIEAFNQHADIHTATAAKVFNIAIDKVDKQMRSKAKMVNFGIIYGISAFGLSERLNIPRSEAKEIIESYFMQFNGLKTYMNNCIEFARKNGYAETLIGRRRYLRDINSANAMTRGFAERNAINAPIQGTAADMIKIAMINIHKQIEKLNLKSKMILQVHDELVFDVVNEELEHVKNIVTHEMKNAIQLKVPVEIETGTGLNWLQAH